MSVRRLVPIAIGAAVVVALWVIVGADPFLRGFAAVSPTAIAVAMLLAAVTTAASATRWRAVAGGLGLTLNWTDAVGAYYRSQFLNSVLPGGVVGDVHRAYRHGRASDDLALSARAVATERIAGQVVQFGIAAVVLAVVGVTSSLLGMAWLAGAVVLVLAIAVGIASATVRGRRVLSRELALFRQVFSEPRRSLVVAGSSVVVVASLSAMFLVACLAVGVQAPVSGLIALALLALTAAALPINVGGWGPREAAAASAFAVVGLGADAGVAASTAFGVLSLIAVAPGGVLLLLDRLPVSRSTVPEEHTA